MPCDIALSHLPYDWIEKQASHMFQNYLYSKLWNISGLYLIILINLFFFSLVLLQVMSCSLCIGGSTPETNSRCFPRGSSIEDCSFPKWLLPCILSMTLTWTAGSIRNPVFYSDFRLSWNNQRQVIFLNLWIYFNAIGKNEMMQPFWKGTATHFMN